MTAVNYANCLWPTNVKLRFCWLFFAESESESEGIDCHSCRVVPAERLLAKFDNKKKLIFNVENQTGQGKKLAEWFGKHTHTALLCFLIRFEGRKKGRKIGNWKWYFFSFSLCNRFSPAGLYFFIFSCQLSHIWLQGLPPLLCAWYFLLFLYDTVCFYIASFSHTHNLLFLAGVCTL